MKAIKLIQVLSISAALTLTSLSASAVTTLPCVDVPNITIKEHNGKLTKAQIAVALRRLYKGFIPKITARPIPGFPNCHDWRGTRKGTLLRGTANCKKPTAS